MLAIDDDDVETLARQPLGDQSTGDPGADDERIAGPAFIERRAWQMPRGGKPGRGAAAQIGLFGLI